MQIVGRDCVACGRSVDKVGDADGCGPCDLVVCTDCLDGTSRCPSCHEPFQEARDLGVAVETRAARAHLARGRQQLIAVAVTLIGSIVLIFAMGGSTVGVLTIQLIVVSLLTLQMFCGAPWARFFVVAMTVLFGLGNLYNAVRLFSTEGSSWPINAGLSLLYLWCAFILFFSRPVGSFMRDQRVKNR